MHCSDQLNRDLHFPKPPSTIVSLVPSITQLLVALGLEKNILGITKFCVEPDFLRKEKTVVGGTKSVHFDKIAALSPDIIVANKEENTKEMVTQLSEIAPVWVSDVSNYHSHMELIRKLSKLFNIQSRGTSLINTITKERESFQRFMKDKPWRRIYYLIWKDPYMVAGKGTFIDDMLQGNHFENLCSEDRYPEISEEELSAADLLLLSSEPFPFTAERAKEIEKELCVKTLCVNGEYFSWYGGKSTEVYQYFRKLH
ncbi:MAG: cobalamin-binding protein [Flavobacteriaceae bacterium]|nr:cobalamin-binding protein [Flavobacteriaceae bacterium]|tara:strand:- start:10226 stop:10993 length:768 start_codon:yes stop_codon:yes gene_type:complete